MQELIKELDEIHAKHEKLVELKREKERELAVAMCPLKIGDIVTSRGYSHRGKKMVVTHIFYKQCYSRATHGYEHGWAIGGNILKKDGSASALQAGFDKPQYEDGL